MNIVILLILLSSVATYIGGFPIDGRITRSMTRLRRAISVTITPLDISKIPSEKSPDETDRSKRESKPYYEVLEEENENMVLVEYFIYCMDGILLILILGVWYFIWRDVRRIRKRRAAKEKSENERKKPFAKKNDRRAEEGGLATGGTTGEAPATRSKESSITDAPTNGKVEAQKTGSGSNMNGGKDQKSKSVSVQSEAKSGETKSLETKKKGEKKKEKKEKK